jgi:hypothetical protein
MTEQEWLDCADPTLMLSLLLGKATDRKLRLFALASFACIRHLPTDENDRRVIELADRYADGNASDMERQQAWETIDTAKWEAVDAQYFGEAARLWVRQQAVARSMTSSSGVIGLARSIRDGEAIALIYCIFGNPFRPVAIDPMWLRWHGSIIQQLAQTIYDERCFADLPILADALEDAGCDHSEILSHCRSPGPHVRGCWVVDLLLGKT